MVRIEFCSPYDFIATLLRQLTTQKILKVVEKITDVIERGRLIENWHNKKLSGLIAVALLLVGTLSLFGKLIVFFKI